MKKRAAALASAAALSMTGCSFFSPNHPAAKNANTPATRPEITNADADRVQAQIEALYGKPGSRKNVPFTQPATPIETPSAENVLPGARPLPAKPAVAEATTMPATTLEPKNTAAMGAMATTPAATQPAVAAEPTMEQVLTLLRKQVASSPRSLQTALALELLNLSQGGKTEDLTPLGLNSQDSKLLTDLATAVGAMTAAGGTSLAERGTPISKTVQTWQTAADLKIPKIALASRVDSFGVYTPVENKFPAGKRSVVIIYIEVANFTSQKTGDYYVTSLTQQDTLVAEDALIAWRSNPEDVDDRCRNQRHDFYLIKKLTLPETLATGKYTLRMTVTDKLGNKTDTAMLDVEIVK